MHDADRLGLLFGSYRPPRCRIGGWLRCAVRGRVRVVAISDARIPWPLTYSGTHPVPVSNFLNAQCTSPKLRALRSIVWRKLTGARLL